MACKKISETAHTEGRQKEAEPVIICQMHPRIKAGMHAEVYLDQVAQVDGPPQASFRLPLHCPKKPGVWKISALDAARALRCAHPQEELMFLGSDACYVHRVHADKPDPFKWLRAAAAFSVLFFGSVLGLAWFHSDVDMPHALAMLFSLLTGAPPEDSRWITLPYVAGVALGVCVFYAIPRKNAVTPLEVKLTEYQGDMEQTEAKDAHEST